jgi:hypothetical protein
MLLLLLLLATLVAAAELDAEGGLGYAAGALEHLG